MLKQILRIILPKKVFKQIEESSKNWIMTCTKCGYSISVWDYGGIRFGAHSYGKRELRRCPKCQKITLFSYSQKKKDA